MATITLTPGDTLHPTRAGNTAVPYLVEYELDLAAAAVAKGSALAASDIIEVLDVVPGTFVHASGFEVLEAMTGTSTDATLDMGVSGVDTDAFVDGFDLDAASVGDFATFNGRTVLIGGTADTIDVAIATQTGTITGGKLRCWAIMTDVSDRVNPGRALIGS